MSCDVEIHTDGACLGNPGPGGWGAVLLHGDREKLLSGYEAHTTNNRMELMAAIEGLAALRKAGRVIVFTDSRYVQQGISEWLSGWKRRGWRTAGGAVVKNIDLWQRLDEVASRHQVEWRWVKGHAGHVGNERADALARSAAECAREANG